MLFSVIIPTYNRADLLRYTLESVFAQQFKDFEVIVVDDGSTDDTAEVVKWWGDSIQFLHTEHLGPGAARNFGTNKANGEYIAFLDSDDLWFPWTLKIFAQLIRTYDCPVILSAKLKPFFEERELSTINEMPIVAEVFDDYFVSHSQAFFVGAGMSVLRRGEFLKTGGYSEKLLNAEDHDLILRMGIDGGFVQIIEPFTLGWRRHAGSVTMNTQKLYEGIRYLIQQELLGSYPGGHQRLRQRREIISRHVRPVVMQCLKEGLRREAWALYRETFQWHVALGRWKYLTGFCVKAFLADLQSLTHS